MRRVLSQIMEMSLTWVPVSLKFEEVVSNEAGALSNST